MTTIIGLGIAAVFLAVITWPFWVTGLVIYSVWKNKEAGRDAAKGEND